MITEIVKLSEKRTIAVVSKDDVEPILEANKKTANYVGKQMKGIDYMPVAFVPDVVQMQWIQKYGFNPLYAEDKTILKRLLNSSEFRYLRTSEIML